MTAMETAMDTAAKHTSHELSVGFATAMAEIDRVETQYMFLTESGETEFMQLKQSMMRHCQAFQVVASWKDAETIKIDKSHAPLLSWMTDVGQFISVYSFSM